MVYFGAYPSEEAVMAISVVVLRDGAEKIAGTVESMHGEGSTFTVRLPLRSETGTV